MFRKHILTGFLCLVFTWGTGIRPALATSVKDEVTISESRAIVSAINDSTLEEIEKSRVLSDVYLRKLGSMGESIAKVMIDNHTTAANEGQMPTNLDILSRMLHAGVMSRFLADQAEGALSKTTVGSGIGKPEVGDVATGGVKLNPTSKTYLMNMANLGEILDTVFCNPDSSNATQSCAAKQADAGMRPEENFIDFFISERTWPDKTVLAAMTLARVFYGAGTDKIEVGNGVNDPGAIKSDLTVRARSNLKLSILNDLAARRAPTSYATPTILRTMLSILAPSGEINSINYEGACKKGEQTPLESYACSFTTEPETGEVRIISQAATDKILQFDYNLSSDMYSHINSMAYNSKQIEKMEVFLKAQQLTQDYRQLRLLQMKAIALASNMMNTK